MDKQAIAIALACKCPRCGQGNLFPPGFNLTLQPACPVCGLNLAKNDNGDGPTVFLIFLLGFSLVPMALIFENMFSPPMWVHAVLWGTLATALTLGLLRPLKAFVIALQYKHRPGDWE